MEGLVARASGQGRGSEGGASMAGGGGWRVDLCGSVKRWFELLVETLMQGL